MKKRTKTICILAAALLGVVGLYCALVLPLNGSILHKAVLTHRVRDYVTETCGVGFAVERAVYDFKTNEYLCYVQSETSVDTRFGVYEDKDGGLTDHYEFEVRENIIGRLSREMDQRMEQEFLPAYPWECVNWTCSFAQDTLDGGPLEEGFVPDMELDMQSPPLPLEITLWVVRNDPSWETLAEALREAARTADSLGWNVACYSVTLHTPPVDGKPIDTATDFCGYRISREMIDGDSLADHLKGSVRRES